MIQRLLCLFLGLFFTFNIVYSQTDIFSNSVPLSVITCGDADTVTVTVYSVGGASSVSLLTSLTSNFEFVSLVPNPNVTITDTSNINLPRLENVLLIASEVESSSLFE